MNESRLNQFRFVLQTLPWTDFQYFASLYLKDLGFDCTIGPMPGQDAGHDVYVSRPGARSMIAFVSLAKGPSAVASELKRALRCAREAGASPKSELWIVHSKRIVSPDGEEALKSRLLAAASSVDPRYNDHLPTIVLRWADQILHEVVETPLLSSWRFLHSRLRHAISADDLGPLDDSVPSGRAPRDTEYLAAVKHFSSSEPGEDRDETLRTIIQDAWDALFFQPDLAERVTAILPTLDHPLPAILTPLCSRSLTLDSDPHALLGFIRMLTHDLQLSPTAQHHANVLATRVIRHLAYAQPSLFDAGGISEVFTTLSESRDPFWAELVLDLFLRTECHYVILPAVGRDTLHASAMAVAARTPKTVLAILLPAITDPIGARNSRTWDAFWDWLCGIASRCTSALSARWCLTALTRVRPLFAFDDDEDSRSLEAFAAHIPYDVASRSASIQHCILTSLLQRSLRDDTINRLHRFETSFQAARAVLFPPQVAHLQLEYASCVYVWISLHGADALQHLAFGEAVIRSLDPLTTPLLRNSLVLRAKDLPSTLSLDNPAVLLDWIRGYTKSLFAHFGAPFVRRSVLNSLQLSASTRPPHLRQSLVTTLNEELQPLAAQVDSLPPSICAMCIRVMDLLPTEPNCERLFRFCERAFKGDAYGLIRNAASISRALHAAFYYSPEPLRKVRALELFEHLVAVAPLGEGPPSLYWAYYAAVHYGSRPQESLFVRALVDAILMAQPDPTDLAIGPEAELGASVSTVMIDLVSHWATNGSLVAALLANDLLDPEVWNLLGTTIRNNRAAGPDFASSQAASIMYALARCGARGRLQFDQKYSYNYIRCSADAKKASGEQPSAAYFTSVLLYITSPAAQQFSYRRNCLSSFFELAHQYSALLTPTQQEGILRARRTC